MTDTQEVQTQQESNDLIVVRRLVPRPVGRPTVCTPIILERLRQAFALGCTDEEACAYAGIATATLYNYQNNNPEFLEEKEQLKQEPVLKARETVVNSLDDVETAKWYLQRKAKKEFSNVLVDINNDNRSINIVKDDPRVLNTLVKAVQAMVENSKDLLKDEQNTE